MRENEEYRQKIIESRDIQRRENNSTQEHLDRIKKIKEDSELALEEKVSLFIYFLCLCGLLNSNSLDR